ncbi:MAG TPA: hypothetical protein VN436_03685 [Holophaga sp.]|nr:hypothetical protein [Holophaga sp.]
MNPDQAAHVLEPIWAGFLAARLRLGDVRESIEPGTSLGAIARHVCDCDDAADYLETVQARFLASETGGLMTILQGRGNHTWPNVYPDPGAMRRVRIAYHAHRFEAELGRSR